MAASVGVFIPIIRAIAEQNLDSKSKNVGRIIEKFEKQFFN